MATGTATKKPRKAAVRVELPPSIEFEVDNGFQPVTNRAVENPYIEHIKSSVPGLWYKYPVGLTETQEKALEGRLRSAGQTLGLALKFRRDASSGIMGWTVSGPISRRPRKAKAEA